MLDIFQDEQTYFSVFDDFSRESVNLLPIHQRYALKTYFELDHFVNYTLECDIPTSIDFMWEELFDYQKRELQPFVFSNYGRLLLLSRKHYLIILVEYIKRSPHFIGLYEYLNQINTPENPLQINLGVIEDMDGSITGASMEMTQYEILETGEHNVRFNGDIEKVDHYLKLLEHHFPFFQTSLQKSEYEDFAFNLSFRFNQSLKKNVKVEPEARRLFVYDILEASAEIQKQGLDLGKANLNEAMKKDYVLTTLCKTFYDSNPLESAKNQVYKLYREAKNRVHGEELIKYF